MAAAFASRCSSLVLPDAPRPPHATQPWLAQGVYSHQRPCGIAGEAQLRKQGRQIAAFRAISGSLSSSTAPAGCLDQALFPAGALGSSAGSNGAPVKDDGKVMVTFRWPAALGGQNVSVVGARIQKDSFKRRCSM